MLVLVNDRKYSKYRYSICGSSVTQGNVNGWRLHSDAYSVEGSRKECPSHFIIRLMGCKLITYDDVQDRMHTVSNVASFLASFRKIV